MAAQDLDDCWVLLWTLAEEMAAEGSKRRADCWIELMDAFWQGELAPGGLALWQSDPATQGGEMFQDLTRDDLVVAALGEAVVKSRGLDASLLHLLGWNFPDYAKINLDRRCIFSTEEGKRGLCMRRGEFECWKSKADKSVKQRQSTDGARALADVESEHLELWLSREIELTHRRVNQAEVTRNSPTLKLAEAIREPLQHLLEKVIQKLSVSNDPVKHCSLAQTKLSRFIVELRPTIRGLAERNSLSMHRYKIVGEVVAQMRSDLEIALKLCLPESNSTKKEAALETKQVERPQLMRAPKAKAMRRKSAECTLAELMKKEWPDGIPPNLKAPDRNRKIGM